MVNNKMSKENLILRKILLIGCSILLLMSCIFGQASVSVANAAASGDGWKNEYKKIIGNWKLIEKYQDMSYFKSYFGADYKFDQYFLCDIDGNKKPELFLYSSTMGLTAVLTYSNKKINFLMMDSINKINIKNSTIIIQGHWHGAGGSGENEWTVYNVKKNSCILKYYIDYLGGNYSVYDTDWKCISSKKAVYNKILSKYVKASDSIDFKDYEKYKLSNKQGFNNYSK